MSVFNKKNAAQVANQTEYESAGGSLEPIPAGTVVTAYVKNAEIKEYEMNRYIQLRWDVLAPAEFNSRVIFQKLSVWDDNNDKALKAYNMLGVINNAAGGRINMEKDPEPQDLFNLFNLQMVLKLDVWEIGDKKGNWVSKVAIKNQLSSAAPVRTPEPVSQNMDDDIPF